MKLIGSQNFSFKLLAFNLKISTTNSNSYREVIKYLKKVMQNIIPIKLVKIKHFVLLSITCILLLRLPKPALPLWRNRLFCLSSYNVVHNLIPIIINSFNTYFILSLLGIGNVVSIHSESTKIMAKLDETIYNLKWMDKNRTYGVQHYHISTIANAIYIY